MIRVSFWTAVFLVLLRLCIGWHFAYEGYGKVKSAYLGKASVNEKRFSSETYFRESEGPFGKLVKSRIGDPDEEVVAKLTLKPVDGDPSKADPKGRFPTALENDWDDYRARFESQYRLDDAQKAEALKRVDQAKADFVKWVGVVRTAIEKYQEQRLELVPHEKGKEPKKPAWGILKVKRKAPGVANSTADYEEEMTPAERAAELKKKSDEVKAGYEKMFEMGKDADAIGLRALKADVATIRTELQKEIDDKTKAMKDALAAILGTKVTAYAAQAENKDATATLQAMLTPMTMPDSTNPLAKMWAEYAEYVKEFAPDINDGKKAEVDRSLAEAKVRFDRWLADKDPFTDQPSGTKEVETWRKEYAAAEARKAVLMRALPAEKKEGQPPPKPTISIWLPAYMTGPLTTIKADADAEIKTLTSQMQAELKGQSDALRAEAGASMLGDDRAKGYSLAKSTERAMGVFPKSWTLIDYLDWSTRWFLLVVGGLLLIGLFSRLSCFAAAGFLLLTVLTQPSLPWIPAPPNSEGNYLVINKNVIEMVALLVLMTTRSGQWFGLDAIVSWMFGRRRRETEI
jgi:uncharacterized membrane protein YphA (DoxX/SURF4 family)